MAIVTVAGFAMTRSPVQAASFTVNSTIDAVDANPGDGSCDDGAGNCTLRAAIMEANTLVAASPTPKPVLRPATATFAANSAAQEASDSGEAFLLLSQWVCWATN